MAREQNNNEVRDNVLNVVRDAKLKRGKGSVVRHNDIMLGIHDVGWHHIIRGGRPIIMPERRLCVFWAMTPYQSIDFPEGTSSYFATVALQTFLSWRISPRLTEAMLAGDVVGMSEEDEADWDIGSFDRWHRLHQQSSNEAQKIILLEIEARLRRMALEMGTMTPQVHILEGTSALPVKNSSSTVSSIDIDRVAEMARYIAINYQNTIDVSDVAASANLHPNYAMQLFRRSCGFTLLHYITQHRVWSAQRLLITTDLKLSEISFQCGFGSEDRLYPVFRKHCGCSPRTYRMLHQNQP